MAPAWYDVYSIKSGYIDENFSAYSCGAQEDQDNSITTTLPSDTMRIILNWPKTNPQTAVDLDSNLYSPNSAGNGWDRIFYSNNETYGTDTVILDKDDDRRYCPTW